MEESEKRRGRRGRGKRKRKKQQALARMEVAEKKKRRRKWKLSYLGTCIARRSALVLLWHNRTSALATRLPNKGESESCDFQIKVKVIALDTLLHWWTGM